MTMWHALLAGYLRLQTQLIIRNTYRFSTATNVASTRLSVTLYVNCLSCLEFVLSRMTQHNSSKHLNCQLHETTLHFTNSYFFELSRTTEMACIWSCYIRGIWIFRLRPSWKLHCIFW